MYFPEDDDATEIDTSSLVDNDTQQPAAGNTFMDNLRGIWATIEHTLDAMNDPFAGDDISEDEANNAYKTITDEYARRFATYYNCGDDETPCSDSAGIPTFITWTPTKGKKDSADRDATFTGLSEMTSSSSGSPSDSRAGVLNEAVALYLSKKESQSLIFSGNESPPNTGEFGLTLSGNSTPPLYSQSPGDKIDTGATHSSSASKSIIAKVFEEESKDDMLEIQSVATSILSGAFSQDIKKALAKGDASKIYKAIAKILYEQNVPINVRSGAQRGKSNEGQMREIWGSNITDFAKSADARCYLCGGQIVSSNPGGGQPEMEHKLPCAVFYAKFAFIYSCFANELTAWRTYVANLDENSLLMQYYTLMNSSVDDFNKAQLDEMYQRIKTEFLSRLNKSSFDAKNLNLFINFVLPAYLSEFAYSHHLCNRLKSNHDLSTEPNLTNYYRGLEAILNGTGGTCDTGASKDILRPACIDPDFCSAEKNAIIAGLRKKIPLRKKNVQAQMTYLDLFASEYAKESKTTEKRMILRTIKETIRTMQIKTSSDGKITKKEIKQMNVQARMIAQGLMLNTMDASNFLVQLKKDIITGDERDRSRDKARDRINIYLDRIHKIFENVFDTPKDINRQLKNAYVSPAIKIRIYNNTNAYYRVLNEILNNINDKIDKLRIARVSLGDNNELLRECESFVSNLNTGIIEKYQEKISEWEKPTGVATTSRKPQSSATSTFPKQPVARRDTEMNVAAENARNTAGLKRRRPVTKLTDDEVQILEAEKREALKQKAIQQNRERAERAQAKDKFDGGRRRQVRKTRKLKRRPRKTIKRVGRRTRTMKRKHRSRKNTRRR